MRFASQIVAFFIVIASLAGPCLAAANASNATEGTVKTGLSDGFKLSTPCKEDCQKRQCTKAVINRLITQVRVVLLPVNDGPVSSVSRKTRLRDRKLSRLFAKIDQPCNHSVDLFALCRQLN